MPINTIYYFGCYQEAGHYMFKPGMSKDWDFCKTNPWGYDVDGGLYSKRGGISLHKKDGWTLIAFIDNTVDDRPGSNSSFIAKGDFTVEQMKELAVAYFPDICMRVGLALKGLSEA